MAGNLKKVVLINVKNQSMFRKNIRIEKFKSTNNASKLMLTYQRL